MANFAPFDYGNVLAQAENIKGARLQNALAQRQQSQIDRQNALLGNPQTTPEAFIRGGMPQVGNALIANRQLQESELQQHRQWLIGATQKALQDPSVWPAVLEEGKRLGVIRPDMSPAYEPEKLKQFLAQIQSQTPATGGLTAVIGPNGNPQYVRESQAVGQEPYRMTGIGMPGSLQELAAVNADRKAAGLAPMSAEEYLTQRRQTSGDMQAYNQYLAEAQNNGEQPMSFADYKARIAGQVSSAQTRSKTEEERLNAQIEEGYKAADAIPVMRRSIELLDQGIKTGGWNALALYAKNRFGVTGADEGELSANLGKAVLSQLRSTFGAQFTEREGARLAEIEAGFGKSAAVNRRLVEQAMQLVERTARRGIIAAKRTGSAEDARSIEDAMNLTLEYPAQGGEAPAAQVTTTPKVGDVVDGWTFLGGDPSSPASWKKQ